MEAKATINNQTPRRPMTNPYDRIVTGIARAQAAPPRPRRPLGPRTEADYWALHEVELVKLGRSTQHLMSFRVLNAPDVILTRTARLVWRRAWRCMRIKCRLDGMSRPMRLAAVEPEE
jgi:hypothetical protein